MGKTSIADMDLGPDVYFDDVADRHDKKAARRARKAPKRRRKRKNPNPAWAWILSTVMLCALGALTLFIVREQDAYAEFVRMRAAVSVGGFYAGITIDGQDVTGRMLDDVMAQWREADEARRAGLDVTLRCGTQVWALDARTLNYTSDYPSVIREAWALGREGTARERYAEIIALAREGRAFVTSHSYDDGMLRTITGLAAETLSVPATEAGVAGFNMDSHTFILTDEAMGTYVDASSLYDQALAALNVGRGGTTINIVQQPVKPTVTKAWLSENLGFIGEYSTGVGGSEARRNNIRLATEMLNGLRIEPGEVFSFNGTVGKRTEERGFQMAPVYANGVGDIEPGGGVCQVSSTLFNAVLLADLNVIERSPHTRPASYVPVGLDATVSWDIPDFKFQNDTYYPVFLVTHYDASRYECYTAIYGQKLPNGMYVTVEARTTETLPTDNKPVYVYTRELPSGQMQGVDKARDGYKAEAYKVYHNADGSEYDRMLYIRSTYEPSGPVYLVGR